MTSAPDLTLHSQYGNAWESTKLISKDGWILDPQNRVVILHGINLSGGTKMPFYQSPTDASMTPSTPTSKEKAATESNEANVGAVPGVIYSYDEEHFYNHRDVSFVNRPFPLQDAELHFERLARWGCQCLRVLVPWEALEHSGPIGNRALLIILTIAYVYNRGIYDEDYIDYLIKLLKIAAKPGWTLELAGLEITKFNQTGAAVVQNTSKDKDNYPKMIWATNSIKTAAATMYTLFFAGQVFAPNIMVPLSTTVLSYLREINSTVVSDEAYRRGVPGGIKAPSPVQNLIPIPRTDPEFVKRGHVNIQHFLQGHFMEAFAHLTHRIREDDIKSNKEGHPGLIDGGTVMGFDSLNEPSPGYLNHPDMNKLLDLEDLQIGTCPTPFQGLQLAQGETVKCEVWETGGLGPMSKGHIVVNQEKTNLWKRPYWNTQRHDHKQHSTEAPTTPSPSGASPSDIVARLKISVARKGRPESNLDSIEESYFSKHGWPEPIGYSNQCLWAENGVWDPKTGKLLKPNYFQNIPTTSYIPPEFHPGKLVEWKQDFWLPFVNTFSLRLRQQDVGLTIFVEPPINEAPPVFRLDKVLISGAGDRIKHIFQTISRWRPLKSLSDQQNATTASHNQSPVSRIRDNSDGNDSSGSNTNDNENALENAADPFGGTCRHAIFDPVGDVQDNVVVAPHFYDGYTNVTRDFVPFTLDYLGYKNGLYWSVLGALKFGWNGVGNSWTNQVKEISSDIQTAMGKSHGIMMGETGIPMDMHNKISYKKRYGSPKQSFAMKLMLDAMDANMLSFTLWNYCVDNSNQWGDRWNGEDFSVWCDPENTFLGPEFKATTNQLASNENGHDDNSTPDQLAITNRPKLTLTEIAAEMGTGKEVAGCEEGCIWWLCLPKTNVWTDRTAPKRLVVFAVDPVSPSTSGDNLVGSDTNLVTSGPLKKPNTLATLSTWQDLLPFSLQIERSRLEFYGGLRISETFIRAYPLAIWGEPIIYRFDPGKPISSKELVSKHLGRKKTNDVPSWENSFFMFFTLSCDRQSKRDIDHSKENSGQENSCNLDNSDKEEQPPSTDVFLPRFHFSLDSPVGVDQFESVDFIQELRHGHASTEQSISSTDKGRWHRLDIQISDGHFSIQPSRQMLQHWVSSHAAIDPHRDLDSKTEFFERVESRIQKLFSLGWDGIEGITTTAEQKWIKKLWKEMKRGEAEAELFTLTSAFSCLWPFSSKRPSSAETEEHRNLKLKELQKRWRDRVGIPDNGVAYCSTCGQLEVMHLHGLSAKLQMWSGFRGK
ncbi:hypothetical protein BGZ79_005172 [Entomortierella chlamydospora]|nr:hypothetical protein BGZ79_005172 [Entomortierella chlamydospora]